MFVLSLMRCALGVRIVRVSFLQSCVCVSFLQSSDVACTQPLVPAVHIDIAVTDV